MDTTYLVDLGSSTVKIYQEQNDTLRLTHAQSIPFKKEYTPEKGIHPNTYRALVDFLNTTISNKEANIHLYATSVFRKMPSSVWDSFKEQLSQDINATIETLVQVSQNDEASYLQSALMHNYTLDNPILLINVGGGSTELIVRTKKNIIDQSMVEYGVGDLFKAFGSINEDPTPVTVEDIIAIVDTQLPSYTGEKISTAFYSGGELTYMQRSGYPLVANNLFNDVLHPSMISFKDFSKTNQIIFTTPLQTLESYMPENPTWMHGARACSAWVEGICRHYGIQTIIPSDANMMDGIYYEMKNN